MEEVQQQKKERKIRKKREAKPEPSAGVRATRALFRMVRDVEGIVLRGDEKTALRELTIVFEELNDAVFDAVVMQIRK